MRLWARYLIAVVVGVAVGLGAVLYALRAGGMGSDVRIGPWTSGTDLGTREQGMLTRAVVARRGLLALPAREARYYNAAVDDAGRPLEGRCRYRITGGLLPVRWWSLTVYDADGYLVGDGPYSVASAAVPAAQRERWTILAGGARQPGLWLPTAGLGRFELTLRTYLPVDAGRTSPARDQLPSIRREACA